MTILSDTLRAAMYIQVGKALLCFSNIIRREMIFPENQNVFFNSYSRILHKQRLMMVRLCVPSDDHRNELKG